MREVSKQTLYISKKEAQKNEKKKSGFRQLMELIILIFAAIILAYGFVAFVCQTVVMMGSSMEPTIAADETLYMNKLIYKVSEIQRYDIVAIRKKDSTEYYDIKRVVGVPGDRISVVGGKLAVNGQHVDESYAFCYISNPGRLTSEITLGDNEYFVIGDNTSLSDDSRYINYGNIQKTEIKGKVIKLGD